MMKMIRSIISAVSEGSIKMFSGSGRANENFVDREFFQQYGFSSRPLQGAEGILIKQGNIIYLIATDDRRYRIELQDGEVTLFTDEGDYFHMKRGNETHIKTGTLIVDMANEIRLGKDAAHGVVTGECICSYTGNPHPDKSTKVKAVKQ